MDSAAMENAGPAKQPLRTPPARRFDAASMRWPSALTGLSPSIRVQQRVRAGVHYVWRANETQEGQPGGSRIDVLNEGVLSLHESTGMCLSSRERHGRVCGR